MQLSRKESTEYWVQVLENDESHEVHVETSLEEHSRQYCELSHSNRWVKNLTLAFFEIRIVSRIWNYSINPALRASLLCLAYLTTILIVAGAAKWSAFHASWSYHIICETIVRLRTVRCAECKLGGKQIIICRVFH